MKTYLDVEQQIADTASGNGWQTDYALHASALDAAFEFIYPAYTETLGTGWRADAGPQTCFSVMTSPETKAQWIARHKDLLQGQMATNPPVS